MRAVMWDNGGACRVVLGDSRPFDKWLVTGPITSVSNAFNEGGLWQRQTDAWHCHPPQTIFNGGVLIWLGGEMRADIPPELHDIIWPKRRMLTDFPCPHLLLGRVKCGDDCGQSCMCDAHSIYREHLEYQQCARTLGIYMRWMDNLDTNLDCTSQRRQGERLEMCMREVLRRAGIGWTDLGAECQGFTVCGG